MKIINVVGARPNLRKIAPLVEEMRRHAAERIVAILRWQRDAVHRPTAVR